MLEAVNGDILTPGAAQPHSRVSRRRDFLRQGGAAAAATAAAAAVPLVRPGRAAAYGRLARPIGTWEEILNIRGGALRSHISYHPDLTVTNTANNGTSGGSAFHQCRLGRWLPNGQKTFEYFVTEFRWDANGDFIGYHRPHGRGTLSSDGQSYTADVVVGVYDTNDKLLSTFAISGLIAKLIPFPPY